MIYHHSITVDFDTREPYARSTIEGLIADFVKGLGGELKTTVTYCDEEESE